MCVCARANTMGKYHLTSKMGLWERRYRVRDKACDHGGC